MIIGIALAIVFIILFLQYCTFLCFLIDDDFKSKKDFICLVIPFGVIVFSVSKAIEIYKKLED